MTLPKGKKIHAMVKERTTKNKEIDASPTSKTKGSALQRVIKINPRDLSQGKATPSPTKLPSSNSTPKETTILAKKSSSV
jgi:hypothetical protein